MKHVQQNRFPTRESILKLLTEAEVASVHRAETSGRPGAGDEYLDLNHLDRGVCRAGMMLAPIGRVLTRKAVPESTWRKITEQLTTLRLITLN